MNIPPVIHIKYPFDKDLLRKIAADNKKDAIPYVDPRLAEIKDPTGKCVRVTGDQGMMVKVQHPYTDKIIEDLGLTGKGNIRYGWLPAHSVLEEHIDNGTEASLNIILSPDPAPVTYNGVDYHYTAAILNVQEPHSVRNGPVERHLCRISIFGEKYDSVVYRLTVKGYA